MITWLRSLLSKKAKETPSPVANEPPWLPTRCGTILMRADAETRRKVAQGWDDDEQRYIDWVQAHPDPKPE